MRIEDRGWNVADLRFENRDLGIARSNPLSISLTLIINREVTEETFSRAGLRASLLANTRLTLSRFSLALASARTPDIRGHSILLRSLHFKDPTGSSFGLSVNPVATHPRELTYADFD